MQLFDFQELPIELQSIVTYRDYRAGELVYCQGKSSDTLYVVRSGRVRNVRYTFEGRAVTLRVVRDGEMFGEIYSTGRRLLSDSAICEINSSIAVFPKTRLLAIFRRHPHLAELFTHNLLATIRAMSDSLELREIRSARKRTIRYLQLLCRPNCNTISFDRPYKYIAEEIGLSPEVFYRTLSELERDRVIVRSKKTVTLASQLNFEPSHHL